ncbi:putative extracellular serine carboxypeptidase [Pseudocercospora fuligena]|uniref:Putative extracellular serine carboxypeptidase n=1 Tax=Pseudocercospora fuligena TaxID=685502 RepID=A0A8H6RK84_9PEZI|nr:putative extracellular serine carboxypeptidase [Pseudocercospora fuligena]
MKSFLAALVLASTVTAQWDHGGEHGGFDHGVGHGHGHGSWDWNGGYPHGSWGYHVAGGQAPPDENSYSHAYFDQLIDHSNPKLGTFKQFYYYDTTYWRGPGSPVVFFTPGEVNATRYYSYLTTNRTTGVLASQIGAATIVLEHRYWGTSTPYADLTTANLKYLTLENAIADMNYFATNVKLPFDRYGASNADDVPWVVMGGSYSGALSAWIASTAPGPIWAYHSSSAPVEAVGDYWGYFKPVQDGMPKNCSKDLALVIDHMDDILMNGSKQQQHDLKAMFGMTAVEHNDDFMAALENGPWLWQGNQFYTNTGFFTFCDYIENAQSKSTKTIPGAEGVGVQKALAGYAKWWTEVELKGFCAQYGYTKDNNSVACFDTYNPNNPMYTDTSLSNTIDRQWVWMTCNEPFGYWQNGAPKGRPSIVSRLIDNAYYERQCGLYFPTGPNGETYGLKKGKTYNDVNKFTGGWNIDNTTRMIYVNGDNDPWREASVSADLRTGGPLKATKQVPIEIVPGGYHTSDLITQNGVVNAGCKAVQDRVVAQLAAWVAEFPKKGYKHGGGGGGWSKKYFEA